MLDKSFKFDLDESFGKKEPYNLALKYCSNWKTTKRRFLIVIQTVDGRDLKTKELLGDTATNIAIKNCIKHSRTIAKHFLESNVPEVAYAIVNFNAYKHLHLSPTLRKEAEIIFAKRIIQIIKKLKPTHILFSGDEAFTNCFPEIKYPQYKRGWVHNLSVDNLELKVTSTLDFFRLIENQGQHANLLGFWCRHFAYLHIGKFPFNLSHIKAIPRYIDTIDKFDRLMRRFDTAEICALDTETKNLSVLNNKIYTMQFCMNHEEDVGYVLPVDHPLGHWTEEERLYIKKQLKKRFSKKEGPLLITFNGMFDLRIIRQQLKIPIIWLKVWEIMFGEHALDENVAELPSVTYLQDEQTRTGSKFGGLRPVYCSYGNDFYFQASSFTKEDRATTGTVEPNNKDFLKYASTDVVALVGLYSKQIERADKEVLEGKSFKPYFIRHMLNQMSDTAHAISHMRNDGSIIDRNYLKYLLGTDSPLQKELIELKNQLKVHKEVQQANKELLKDSGFKAGSLFGGDSAKKNWIFNLSKPDHKKKLFLDVLKLEPITQTKGGAPQIDQKFIEEYKDKNKIVSLYGEYQALFKLITTYVKGWYKKLTSDFDSATDNSLRADYFLVDTARLGSRSPNLQQIPSRGTLAKIIKRAFVAKKGHLLIKYDYSAHEVRVWSIVSNDKILAESFRAGQKLRQAYIQNPSEENKKAIKIKGDIHILNVKRFFNKLVDKDHPLRDSVKAVVFGVLYGKGPETLGTDTKKGELSELKSKIRELYNESLNTKDKKRTNEISDELEKLDTKLIALMAEDRTGYAQDIIDKMFSEFKAGARWTESMHRNAEEKYYVFSPIGRIRHLFASLTGDKRIISKQVRRGSNAPIQGYASEIGTKASRLIVEEYYKNLTYLKEKLECDKSDWNLRILCNRAVHDALYFSVPYEMVIPFLHILQYTATYGITNAYKEQFNVDFTIEPEIECEIGADDSQENIKWDWSIPNLISILEETIKRADELKVLEGSPSDVLKIILTPWKSKSIRKYLQDKYPLLNVKDLDKQIIDAIRKY